MNILLKKQKNNNNIINNKSLITNNLSKITNYSPCEWKDSIYSYNGLYNRFLVCKNNISSTLLNSYSSLELLRFINKYIMSKRRHRLKFIRFSAKKVFWSKPEVKHTNSKAIITLYIFNKKQIFLRKKIIKLLKLLKKRRFKRNFLRCLRKISIIYNYILSFNSNKLTNNNNKMLFYLFIKNKRIFKYLKKILYYNKILLIESKKINNFFINFEGLGVIKLLKTIYEKDIEIDIVNHKTNYFNSEILLNSVAYKTKDRNKKAIRILKRILSLVKIPQKMLFLYDAKENDLKSNTLESLKYKSINGIKLKASGRLTRRLTAMRAISKVRSIGGFKNVDSSSKGISAYISRGCLKASLQYTQLDGKTRNGAFGLKCWISSN